LPYPCYRGLEKTASHKLSCPRLNRECLKAKCLDLEPHHFDMADTATGNALVSEKKLCPSSPKREERGGDERRRVLLTIVLPLSTHSKGGPASLRSRQALGSYKIGNGGPVAGVCAFGGAQRATGDSDYLPCAS
jgi:hypothetical protein